MRITDITLTMTERHQSGASYYDMRVGYPFTTNLHHLRENINGYWSHEDEPVRVLHDTFSGAIDEIASLYSEEDYHDIMAWAIDQEFDEEDDA